ncbi:hypothetical protein [Brachybacterium sp. AOP29-B2-41]
MRRLRTESWAGIASGFYLMIQLATVFAPSPCCGRSGCAPN